MVILDSYVSDSLSFIVAKQNESRAVFVTIGQGFHSMEFSVFRGPKLSLINLSKFLSYHLTS